jgi:hypothetical protein
MDTVYLLTGVIVPCFLANCAFLARLVALTHKMEIALAGVTHTLEGIDKRVTRMEDNEDERSITERRSARRSDPSDPA